MSYAVSSVIAPVFIGAGTTTGQLAFDTKNIKGKERIRWVIRDIWGQTLS